MVVKADGTASSVDEVEPGLSMSACTSRGLWIFVTDKPTPNPYRPPQAGPAKLLRTMHKKHLWVRYVGGLQMIVMLLAIPIVLLTVESIVITGPLFALVGLALIIVAVREKNIGGLVVGCSAVGFSGLILGLINVLDWSPAEATKPVTVMVFVYSAVVLPALLIIVIRASRFPGSS